MTKWISSAATTIAVLSLWTTSALAQQITPSDGIQLPDASIATVGDAQALEINPGGLGFLSRPELGYGFQLASEDVRGVADEAQSYFLATGTGWFGAGLAAQWLQKPALGGELQSYRKFTIGMGGAVSDLGFGGNLNFFGSSDDERLDGLMGVDLGFQLRASEHFGAGLMLRDVNTPFLREGSALPARVEGSVALRFWDGRFAVEQMAQTNLRDRYVKLIPRLTLEPLSGMRVFGRTEFSFTRVGDVFGWDWDGLFAGLELSLGSIGAIYAATMRRFAPTESPQFSGITSYHWISPGKKAPLVSPTRRWIWVNLDRPISEEPVSGLFATNTRSFFSVARELERLANAADVEGVVLTVGDELGYAQTWEARKLISAITARGKKTIAVLGSSDLRSYYLATGAEEIWYVPTDVFSPQGLRSRFLSIREAFDKIGVEAQFVRIGDYKSTPEMFVYDEPTEANLEQRNAYLDAYWQQITSDIGQARGKTVAEVETLLTGSHLPDEAVERGLVDRIAYTDELEDLIREEHGAVGFERGFPEPDYSEESWAQAPEIAVVAVDGNIVQGRTGQTPLIGGSVAGAESLSRTLERLRTNPRVRAVVVRIESPGGSAVASDLIYRSIRKVASQKPVIASMSNIATSGGYYVAAGADEIFATPVTTTGSIGIFAGKVNIAQLADRIGVNQSAIERGAPQSFTNIYSAWTDEELEHLGTSLNYMYRLFLTQVAHTRPLSVKEIDAVARGHIWAGKAAKEHQLVDEMGGIMPAIHRAEALAGLEPGEANYRQYKAGSTFGTDIDIQGAVTRWLRLDGEGSARSLVSPTSMVARFIGETAHAWRLPLLYGPGEALMLPTENVKVE